ncbi:MAG: GFA family protein [Sphingobium sp.]|nr:GFA family protein [Sphingobium sp.]
MKNDDRLEGGCLCGAIRYEIDGPLLFVSQCCCKDCQKATGTGHTTIIGIHKSQLHLQGAPTTYTNAGDTGGTVTRHFCGTCGGRIFTSGDLPGEYIMVQAGSLDDPNRVSPESVIYMKDAVAWDFFDPALPKHEGMSPRPHHVTRPAEDRPGGQ